MYRFLECTAEQYMTRAVITVTRQATVRELTELFQKHDFNSFPVVEHENVLGDRNEIRFVKDVCFQHGSDAASLR
jgi:CBS-domain-containing membrane protein